MTREAWVSATPTRVPRPRSTAMPGHLPPTSGAALPVTRGAVRVCWSAPMPDGAWSAAHCRHGGGLMRIGAVAAAWSVDAWRDLMHYAHGADASVAVRPPALGEGVSWAAGWSIGRARIASASDDGYVLACTTVGRIIHGDSGAGWYADSDGALVAVQRGAADGEGGCEGQAIEGVLVP